MTCIATFYSHFEAVRFKKACESRGWPARLMPVPRDLSSSCGTCVRYEGDLPDPVSEGIEQIAVLEGNGYRPLYRAEDS